MTICWQAAQQEEDEKEDEEEIGSRKKRGDQKAAAVVRPAEQRRTAEWNALIEELGRKTTVFLSYAHLPDHFSRLVECLHYFDAIWLAAHAYVDEKKVGGKAGGAPLLGHSLFPRSHERMIDLLQVAAMAEAEDAESGRRLATAWDMQLTHQRERITERVPPPRPTDDLGFLRVCEGLARPCAAILTFFCQIAQQLDMPNVFYSRTQPSFFDLVHSSRKPLVSHKRGASAAAVPSHAPSTSLSTDMLQELSEWIERLVRGLRAPATPLYFVQVNVVHESKALGVLTAFGASPTALLKFKNLKLTYDSRTQGRKAIIMKLRALKTEFPHSSALLHAFAPLWNRHSTFRVLPLPKHYLENQIRAIRGRFQLGPNDPIPQAACSVVLCQICGTMYSLYNEVGQAKHCMHASQCFGYSHIRCDLVTGEMYCSKDVTAHVDFPHAKLSQVWILGNVVFHDGKQWILCPQPNCSMPCVLNDDPRRFGAAGFACSAHDMDSIV